MKLTTFEYNALATGEGVEVECALKEKGLLLDDGEGEELRNDGR